MFYFDEKDQKFYDENGNERPQILQSCQTWADSDDAARMLCMKHATFGGSFRPHNNYFDVRRKLRGFNGKKSARGQGALYHRDDLRRIVHIKRAMHISMIMACRIFQAQRKHLI